MQKLADLSPHLQEYSATVLMLNGKVVLLDKEKTHEKWDIALLWSERDLARAYAASYPSLQKAIPVQMKIRDLVVLFKGRVEYYMLDAPAKDRWITVSSGPFPDRS